jgi:archaetidylinositol phosphate synthase
MDLRYPVTRYLYRPLSMPVASALSRSPVTPTQITLLSAVLALAGAVAFGFGEYGFGALLTFFAVVTDCIDGDLARLTGRTSLGGAFLDSVLDRWTDAALIMGLGFSDPERLGGVAAFALVGSLLASYTRARAQSLGTDCPDGVGARDARMLLLVVFALVGRVLIGLWLVAVFGFVTAVHRMVVATMNLDRLDRESRPVSS